SSRNCPRYGKMVFLEIIAVATPIDNEEAGGIVERRQHAMPVVHADIDALLRLWPEGAQACGDAIVVFGDDHQPVAMPQRIESLATERVTLYQLEFERQGIGASIEDGDHGARIFAAQFDRRQIMAAICHA